MSVEFLESGKLATSIPFPDKFKLLTARMSPDEFNTAVDKLNSMIDGEKILTSSWMPGNNWSGTSFDPIWRKAAKMDFDLSGKLFGLLVFYVFMQRPEIWVTGRFEKDGVPIGGRTYFRKP